MRGNTRADLLTAVRALPNAWVPPGYVLDSDETDDHVTHDTVFCREHADLVARGDALLVGAAMFIVSVSQCEAENSEYCAFYHCGVELDTGGLTKYGVDSVLGLTEPDPMSCRLTPYELSRTALAMRDDDPRWTTWEAHARQLLGEHASRRRRA